ncbi:Microsomal glutathione S-transferase 3 [Lunasporangiospora selenospora]|uniref:Glutathione S-transferase 3, mitochondrial n=1 Tax=Lunasporangiospora selenospora TaxID=979761 RepID=A0A9P6G362_9FUNG|nr:Microsomal glutathione S-transferase 3 [Lunasporangiospora selenospora]
MVSFVLSPDYGYTIATTVISTVLVTVLGHRVGGYRKVANVPLPNMYAEASEAKADKKKMIFNCYQRVHQNTLEGYSSYLVSLLIAGLQYPRASAALGLIWCLGRVFYSIGYTSGDPQKRMWGAWGHIGDMGLLILNGKIAFDLITSA